MKKKTKKKKITVVADITKYPVVLAHGMMVKDFRFYRAFRGIANRLRTHGYCVYVAQYDGIGSIENNATQFRTEILDFLAQSGAEKVNVIAHSKGGLDARYMIARCAMADKVASLTTLSTPHYGSKMSRKILTMPKFCVAAICFFANTFFRICGDKNPDLMTVGKQLRDVEMHRFNETIQNAPEVYYQSYSSTIRDKIKFRPYVPYHFSRHCEGEETDGIVSVSSSQWGDYQGDMGLNADHLQMVGMIGGKKRLEEISDFYVKILSRLARKGF